MKKTKIITCLLTAALIAASFAGCGDSSSAKTEEVALQQEQAQPQGQRGNMAKVVSMEGDTITLLLADMSNDSGKGGGTPPTEGTAPTDATDGGSTPPDGAAPPSGDGQKGGGTPPADGTAPDGTSGAAMDGGSQPGQGGPGSGGREIEFGTEETTYTLSDDVTVTKGMGDTAAEIDLSELAADTVINFTTETDDDGNEVITSIVVME